MKIYLQSIDFDLWLSIENGPHRPTKTENGIEIPKSMIEYTDLDKRLLSMDAKAMNTLYYALNRKVTHEGTNQVKESKIDMLVHQYELFKMLQNESITSMFTRMTSITNSLHALGRTYTNITTDKQDQEERPKKNLAFKNVHQIESDDDDDDEDSHDDLEEDVALITRQCYKCNKLGHIKTDCPLLQAKKKNRFQRAFKRKL
ncbi:zf-CCHC domain-containing protein [Salix suchowensis]|nr:zf-CCHC domain-containing protein [Salix suchowensis]